ncbi:MAG: carboxypeptidase-like regulatory domain-containing protein [Lewinellaceae bacterium]|nr:carboxypeptidase-like regulatory domain-containing protein [Saprospiraceae bacterium]MCB9340572.1 carboxypeptidase-like regulatory domain-containing protein [Lewinellaceae bacterium]
MRITFSFLFFLVKTAFLFAQVKGIVTDTSGEPLPFASVYVQGTTNGTTTNLKGEYFLDLEKGGYQLVFQYIGYKQKIVSINIEGTNTKLDVKLEPESIELSTVEIKANAEDPAYPIIRKAIEKREYYKNLVESFSCDVYIKGNVKILDAPKKLLGQDVGDLDGNLDTTRQGIVYLSESISKLYFKQPDKYKEVMMSSKVSGNNQGFSFNSAQEMDFNLYRNFSKFGRNVMSPIADGAMGYYKYRLQGVIVDEAGNLINKIEVIAKRSEDPVYQGIIYIVDKLWNIQSTDLYLTGGRAQSPFIDTLYIRQTHVPVASPDTWRLFSQSISLVGGALGFKFGGSFTGIFSNYDLAPNLGVRFFGNELMKVEDGANEKDATFWEEVRPVPLTTEETVDYHRKDSIRVVRESKPFLDSLDKVNNKFKFGALLFGYTHQNSWKRSSFTIKSPLNTLQFNAVQGFNLNLDLGFKKAFDKEKNRRLEINGKVNYGFSEEIFRASGGFTYYFNPKKFSRLEMTGGAVATQFNELEPISPLLNTSYALFGHRNYIRLYDKKFFQANYRHEILNGWMLYTIAQFADRSPLTNHSDYSFFYKNSRVYAQNDSLNTFLPDGEISASKALVAGFSLRIRFGQKYYNFPDQKYLSGSKFPDIWLHYRKGISIHPNSGNAFRSDVDYDRLSIAISKNNIALGLAGETSFRMEAGKFLNNKALYFYDYRHFLGNEIQIGNQERYLYTFKMLPYYEFSTRDAWAEAHWQHDFKGFITDKIPGFKKLGWSLVAGANFLYTTEKKDYFEASLGLNNIGFGIVRFFRFDVVSSFLNGKYDGTGYLIGINLPLGDLELL